MVKQRFEHKKILQGDTENFTDVLSKYEKEGWELVDIVTAYRPFRFIFKRPIIHLHDNTLTPPPVSETKINLLKQRIAEVDQKRAELLHGRHIKDADKYYSYCQGMKTALHIFENDN